MDETDKAFLTPVYSKGQIYTLVAVLAVLTFMLGVVVGIAL